MIHSMILFLNKLITFYLLLHFFSFTLKTSLPHCSLASQVSHHHDDEAADVAVFLHQPSKDGQPARARLGRCSIRMSQRILLRRPHLCLTSCLGHT